MSHFSRIQTALMEKEYLLMALKDLGMEYQEGDLSIKGFAGKMKVDIRVSLPLSYDIGFRKGANGYELVADWFGVRGIQRDQFLKQLKQRYAYHVTRSKLEKQGFTLVEEEVKETGQIRLLLRRMQS